LSLSAYIGIGTIETIIRTPNKTNAAFFPIFVSLLSKDYNHGTQKPRTLFPNSLELLQRAHSPQVLPDGSASRAAGLASESKNCKIPYSRREALPQGRTFPAACCRVLQLVTSPISLSIFLYQIKMEIQLGEILVFITENALRNLEKLGKKTQ